MTRHDPRRIAHCSVPEHGTRCVVAREITQSVREQRTRRRRRGERGVVEEGLAEAADGPIESNQCTGCGEWMRHSGYGHPGRCEACEKKYPCSYCDPFGALHAAVQRIMAKDMPWDEKYKRVFEEYWDSDVAKMMDWHDRASRQESVEYFADTLGRRVEDEEAR